MHDTSVQPPELTSPAQSWISEANGFTSHFTEAGIGAWHLDLRKSELLWTDSLYQLCGIELGSKLDVNEIAALLNPQDPTLVERRFRLYAENKAALRNQYRVRLPGGQVRWLDNTTKVLESADGKPIRVGGVIRDITEWQSPLEAALKGENFTLTIQDADLRYVWHNNPLDTFKDINIIGLLQSEVGIDEENKRYFGVLKQRVLDNQKTFIEERWVPVPGGGQAYLKIELSPYTFPDGGKGVLSKIKDCTESERSKERESALKAELETKITELENSEFRFKTALDNSPITLALHDEDLNYVWSYNSARFTQLQDSVTGLHPTQITINQETLDEIQALLRRVLATGQPETLSRWIDFGPGGRRYVQSENVLTTLPGGKPGVMGRNIDLTDQKLAEEREAELNQQLRESQRRLAAGIDNEPFTIFAMGEDRRYKWFYNMPPEWKEEDFLGKTFAEYGLEPALDEVLAPVLEEVISTGLPGQAELWTRSSGGVLFFFRYRVNPYTFADGSHGTIVKAYDLTADRLRQDAYQRMTEELATKVNELEAADLQLRMTMEGEPLGLWVQDKNMRFIWAHNIPKIMYDGDIIGLDDYGLGMPQQQSDFYVALKRQVIESGIDQTLEDWLVLPNGDRLYVRLSYKPYPMPDGSTGVIGKYYDLTEHRLREEELQRIADQLKMAEQRFTAALDDLPLGMWIQDETLLFVWSHNWPKVIYDGDVVGLTEHDFGFPKEQSDGVVAMKQAILDTGIPQNFSTWFTMKGGERMFLRVSLKPYTMPNGATGLIGRYYEPTEHEEAKLEVDALNKALHSQLEALTLVHDTKAAEMQEARALQTSLLPAHPPQWPGLEFAAYMQTSDEVGGDYYDFLKLEERAGLVIALGDATGHGLRAGFIAAMVKAYFTLLAGKVTPIHLLHIISERLAEMNLKQMYMGLTIVCYEEANDHFIYVMAGMPQLRIFRQATGEVEMLGTPSMFLGTDLPLHLVTKTFTLAPGDVLMIASDGLFEARNAALNMIPVDTINNELARVASSGPQAVIDAMRILQEKWQGKAAPDDDTTLVVVMRE